MTPSLKHTQNSARSLCKGYSFGDGGVKLDNDYDDDAAAAAPPAAASYHFLRQQTTTDSTESERSNNNNNDNVPPFEDHELLGGEPSSYDRYDELDGVKEMWIALSDEERSNLSDPSMLVRHWRAENGNTQQAITKIKDTLRWRTEFGLSGIVHCTTEDSSSKGKDDELSKIISKENETGKIYVRGHDAEGRALMYMRPGRENTMNASNNMKHLVWNLEKAIACTKRKSSSIMGNAAAADAVQQTKNSNKNITSLEKINLLIDYDGFRLRDSPPLSTSKTTLEILQNHYPERMHRAYVLNPPLYFKTFWSIIKPFVDPSTKKKIVLVSNEKTMNQLRDAVGQDNLHILETVAGGSMPAAEQREFNSQEYVHLDFDISFDEEESIKKTSSTLIEV